MRLFSWQLIGEAKNLWNAPSLLLQKFPAPDFSAVTKLTFNPMYKGERTGLVVMGLDYAIIGIENGEKGFTLTQNSCLKADKGTAETVNASVALSQSTVYLKVTVKQTKNKNNEGIFVPTGTCSFSYSLDGKQFMPFGQSFKAREGQWIGAKVGLYCIRPQAINDSGYADVDWFRVEKP
jgi:beta-xylosidase